MKTALQTVKEEITELWSSPSYQPIDNQVFEVLDRNEPLFKQQIIDAYNEGYRDGEQETMVSGKNDVSEYGDAINYYNNTFNQPLKGI